MQRASSHTTRAGSWFTPLVEYTYRQVTRTFVHEDKPICEVIVLNFASDFKETLKVTLDHPFYVKGFGWMPAGDLDYTCPLYAKDFGNLAVGKVSVIGERARVYNFEVDEFHTYYVGELAAWVHNTCEFTKPTPLRAFMPNKFCTPKPRMGDVTYNGLLI